MNRPYGTVNHYSHGLILVEKNAVGMTDYLASQWLVSGVELLAGEMP